MRLAGPGGTQRTASYSPGLFDCYVAVEFLQAVLSGVVVHNEDAFFHVGPLGSFEDRDRGGGTLAGSDMQQEKEH